MPGKKPRIISSTAKAASGGVVVVLALIALLFLQGPGTGSGESEGEGLSPMVNAESQSSELKKPVEQDDGSPEADLPNANASESDGLTTDERQALAGNVLGILIDEWDYLMEVPGENQSVYKPAQLEQLVMVAKAAAGDSNGIRVRILQRESARPKAEASLRQALDEIGIGNDAIYMPDEFIP